MAAGARAPWWSGAEQMKLRQRGHRLREEVGGRRPLVARGGRDGAAGGGGVELGWGPGVWGFGRLGVLRRWGVEAADDGPSRVD